MFLVVLFQIPKNNTDPLGYVDHDNAKNKLSTFWVLFYIVTSIGTIAHEIAHAVTCSYITKTKITKIVYFQIPKYNTDSLGYVDHDNVNGYMNNFLVNISPFFVGTFLSVISYVNTGVKFPTFTGLNFPTLL
ncbi:MAG: hypothetical protein WA144_00700 [Candidatus Methanoperedens sp.]